MNQESRSLGKAIRDRRMELGLTQEALAERIGDGVRQSDVSRLERDRIQLPRPQRLRAIARALDMEPGELLIASGWEGITHGPRAPWEDAVQEPGHAGYLDTPMVGRGSTMIGQTGRVIDSHDRLQEALERSRHVRAETEEALQRSREAARSWHRLYGSPNVTASALPRPAKEPEEPNAPDR